MLSACRKLLLTGHTCVTIITSSLNEQKTPIALNHARPRFLNLGPANDVGFQLCVDSECSKTVDMRCRLTAVAEDDAAAAEDDDDCVLHAAAADDRVLYWCSALLPLRVRH